MQLFRQQAIDHQHRLYGEVLLVQPLGWSTIAALLLLLIATIAAFLTFGTYSATVKASGVSRANGRIDLIVPVADIAQIEAGQTVRMIANEGSAQDHRVLHAILLPRIGTNGPVTAQLVRFPDTNAVLPPGIALDARIALAPRSLLQWLVAPHPAKRP